MNAVFIKSTAVVMLLTTVAHALSLVAKSEPANETEATLMNLMATYRIDAGAGFRPTTAGLFTALSSCFSILTLLGGLLLLYLPKRVGSDVLKGVLNIFLVCFGICFAFMAALTFLPPIICTGLIVAGLFAARLTVSESRV